MPLAILMAASWTSTLSPAQIASEIASGGSAGLDFLSSRWRGLPERQRSMRAVLDHSWDLLGERERPALAALSVFQGGFDSAAARAVAGAGLFDLRNWVERSLLQRRSDDRLGMHDLMRQYAAGQLDPAQKEALSRRHAEYYATALERWEVRLKSGEQAHALDEMSAELDNIRAAWTWAISAWRPDLLDQGAHALGLFHLWRCRLQEGMDAFAPAVDAVGESAPHLKPRFLAWRGKLANAANFPAGLESLRQAWRLAADEGSITSRDRAFVGSTLAYDLLYFEEERAVALFREAIWLWEATADRWGLAHACVGLAEAHRYRGQMSEGEPYGQRALALFGELGDRKGQAEALVRLCRFAEAGLRRDEAIRHIESAIALSDQDGDVGAASGARAVMADFCLREGRYSEARQIAQQCLDAMDDLGLGRSRNVAIRVLWTALIHLGLYGQAQRPGGLRGPSQLERHKPFTWGAGLLAGMRELGQGNTAKAEEWLRFALAELPPVIDITQFGLAGLLARSLFLGNQLAEGRPLLRDALRRALDSGQSDTLAENLLSAALLLEKEGRIEESLELATVARRHPAVGNSRLHHDTALRCIEAAAATLPPELADAARQQSLARDLEDAVREALSEL